MALEERIRQRSYEIWVQEGCPEGRAVQNWTQATAEIERELEVERQAARFEYHTVLYRLEEWRRVQPKPRITRPPRVIMASRVDRAYRPVAA